MVKQVLTVIIFVVLLGLAIVCLYGFAKVVKAIGVENAPVSQGN